MRRILSIVIVCSWLGMLVLLVRREWHAAVPQDVEPSGAETQPADEWMDVYQGSHKIGYTHHSLSVAKDGLAFAEESLLQLVVLEQAQTVRTHMRGHTSADFVLHDVEFALSSGAGNLRASAVVEPKALRLTLHTGKDSTEQVLPLSEPIYLPSTLRGLLTAGSLQQGRRVDALVFDPVSLKNDRMRVTIEGREPLPQSNGATAWRIREEFRGIVTTAWTDDAGVTLREEGPMGLVLVRTTADQAVRANWSDSTALDLVAQAAIPVTHPIADPRTRTRLRVRLSGIPLESVPSDEEQTRSGDELTITRPALAELASYVLPYSGTTQADDLKATAFLQSDHPRVQKVAREAMGDERDALRVAVRLNDWVYANLRKVPTVSIPNALQVLDMGEGDCNEHAVLFAALARAVGLPSRTIAGAVYLDGAFLYHAWCEVWLGRWVSIDPALHQFPADATHIKFVIGGPDEQLAMMGIIGRLGIDIEDNP